MSPKVAYILITGSYPLKMLRGTLSSHLHSMGKRLRTLIWLVAILVLPHPDCATAASSLEIVEVWPSGNAVMLQPGDRIFFHIKYKADTPVIFQVQPLYRGNPVKAVTPPLWLYPSDGEAVLWLSFRDLQFEVDEVRITASSRQREPNEVASVATTYAVHLTNGRRSTVGPVPPWIEAVSASNRDIARTLNGDKPDFLMDKLLPASMIAIFIVMPWSMAIVGLAIPIWAIARWRGVWRLAAGVSMMCAGTVMAMAFFYRSGFIPLWFLFFPAGGLVGVSAIAILAFARRTVFKRRGKSQIGNWAQ